MATNEISNTLNEAGWYELSDTEKIDALYLAVNDTRQKLADILLIAQDVKEKAEPVIDALRQPGGLMKLITGSGL